MKERLSQLELTWKPELFLWLTEIWQEVPWNFSFQCFSPLCSIMKGCFWNVPQCTCWNYKHCVEWQQRAGSVEEPESAWNWYSASMRSDFVSNNLWCQFFFLFYLLLLQPKSIQGFSVMHYLMVHHIHLTCLLWSLYRPNFRTLLVDPFVFHWWLMFSAGDRSVRVALEFLKHKRMLHLPAARVSAITAPLQLVRIK